MKDKKLPLILLIILVIIFVIYFIFSKSTEPEKLVIEERTSTMEFVVSEKKEEVLTLEEKIKSHADVLKAELVNVSGGEATGTAYVLRENGELKHYVEADLPVLEEGLFYEGWLVKKEPELEFFSTGVMDNKDDFYTLTYLSKEEYLGFNEVVITLETVIDETPEDHILEGLAE